MRYPVQDGTEGLVRPSACSHGEGYGDIYYSEIVSSSGAMQVITNAQVKPWISFQMPVRELQYLKK